MSWGAVAGAAIGVVGSAMSNKGDKGGGAGSSTASKEPWMPAQPFLMDNILVGQALQKQYMQNPFNEQQQKGFQDQANTSAYVRNVVPGFLNQLSNSQVGFDRNNPTARAQAFNFNQTRPEGGYGGLLDTINPTVAPEQVAANPKKMEEEPGDFRQQSLISEGFNGAGGAESFRTNFGQGVIKPSGGFGTWNYGDKVPEPGSKGYRDYNNYFANGGVDPGNLYGKGQADPVMASNFWNTGGT